MLLTVIQVRLRIAYYCSSHHSSGPKIMWETRTRRECHGFTNPYGLRSRVGTGTGTGWHFRTPVKPAPVTWVSRVLLGYENINKQPLSFSTTTTIHLNHPPPLRHHCHQQSRSTTAHANDTSHDATATRRAPAGLTPHRGDDVARQRYPPDVP